MASLRSGVVIQPSARNVCIHRQASLAELSEAPTEMHKHARTQTHTHTHAHIHLQNFRRMQPHDKAVKPPWSLLQMQHTVWGSIKSCKSCQDWEENLSVLCKLRSNAFIVSTTCFQQRLFSTENKPDLLKEKLQDCEAEITHTAILHSTLH